MHLCNTHHSRHTHCKGSGHFLALLLAACLAPLAGCDAAREQVDAPGADATQVDSTRAEAAQADSTKAELARRHALKPDPLKDNPPKTTKTLVGYGDQMTVRPGDKVNFQVSTYAPGEYRAELLRIIIADTLSDMPLYEVEQIDAPFAGTYPGRTQETYPGSYAEFSDTKALDPLQSFTVVAFIKPTLPGNGVQHIVSRWNDETQAGWSVGINPRGRTTMWLGDGQGQVVELESRRELPAHSWTFITASFDAKNGQLSLYDEPVTDAAFTGSGDVAADGSGEVSTISGWQPAQSGPLRFGAAAGAKYERGDGRGGFKPVGLFTGRLDHVRIARAVLEVKDARRLALSGSVPDDLAAQVAGYWDFVKGIGTQQVHDLSASKLNGVTVNLPMRAMKGYSWTGESDDWKQVPEQYSAMVFHEDDLFDAEWATDFSYTVPADLDSAIYAVRIELGDSEHFMPFFVAPAKGTTQAKVAFLLPTTTYLAYVNYSTHWAPTESVKAMNVNRANISFFLNHLEFGRSTYDRHTDGTSIAHSSWRRPNLTTQPKGWTNNNLVPDTEIGHWLERMGIDFDIIPDDLVDREGVSVLEKYQVVVSGQHPEYASQPMLDGITDYLSQGGRFMYLGGNGFFHLAAWHPDIPGLLEIRRPYEIISPYYDLGESYHEFDGSPGGSLVPEGSFATEFEGPTRGRTQSWVAKNLGVQWEGMAWGGNTYYRVLEGAKNPRAAFIFKGVNAEIVGDYGSHFGGAAGEEMDRYTPEFGAPTHALQLGLSENHAEPIFGPKETALSSLVFFETPSGGAVFSVGSMAYSGALRYNDFDNDIARITTNVIRRFLDPEKFQMPK